MQNRYPVTCEAASDTLMASGSPVNHARSDGEVEAVVRAEIARGQGALEATFRLRYDVYIAEQGKPYGHADHERRWLRDESDAFAGAHVLVTANGRPCATVRALHLEDSRAFAAYRTTLGLDAFAQWPRDRMVVCTRLAALPEFRGGRVVRAALQTLYRHELERGVLFAFHFCAPRLVPLFRRYGFREYLPPFEDAVLPEAHRMLLLVDDVDSLRSCGSPFLPIAQERNAVSQTRTWFTSRFRCQRADAPVPSASPGATVIPSSGASASDGPQ